MKKGKMMGYAKDAQYKEIEIVLDMTKTIYPKESIEWIKECCLSQLQYIRKLLFENLSYKDFCKKAKVIYG